MEGSFKSPFLQSFEILQWSSFDDGASGSIFKVVRRKENPSPVSLINQCGPVFIVKLVNLPSGLATRELREVKLLENIEAENVVRIFGSWEERPPLGFEYPSRPAVNQHGSRLLFILMEYCDLFTLRRWLGWPKEKRSWEDLINIFLQVTKGLVAIHTKGIIHRDLKPSNVGLTCHWTDERVIAKLIDFGLATELRDVMTSQVGTHLFRPPEIHNTRQYDEKADVYALGIILCQMMASLTAEGITCSKLDDEFRQFVEERMSSSYSPSPFDAQTYLEKYRVTHKYSGQMIQLAKNMTSSVPQERPSSLEVLEIIRKTNSGIEDIKVCIYNYLEEVKANQLWFKTEKPADLRSIRTSILNHLTHLTLKNILLTKQQLLETIKECLVLKHLSLSLEISDLRRIELLPMPSVHLRFLKTFRFRLHLSSGISLETDSLTPSSRYGVPRIQSLMFFGPISQIWENKMRVKVSFGEYVLVNIHAELPLSFTLNGITHGFDFLQILNHVQFQNVSLKQLTGKSKEETLDLNHLWSTENMKSVYELNLTLPTLNVMEGRLFQEFSCLTELSVNAPYIHESLVNLIVHPRNTIQFHFLPPSLNRIFLKRISIAVDGMSSVKMRLETLDLMDCEVASGFYERYAELFEIENLRIVKNILSWPGSAVPGLSFVDTALSTSNWNTLILDPFDWRVTIERSQFREEFIESFFPNENDESLKGKGLFLELIDGYEEAQLTDRKDSNVDQVLNKPWKDWYKLASRNPDDSDNEESRLLVERGLADVLDKVDERQLLPSGLETLDNRLEENLEFKGTLSYPSYPETGWETFVSFEKFKGIPQDKSKERLKRIHLTDVCLGSSLPMQLNGCVHLESLVMDNVTVDSPTLLKMTSRLPALKNYSVNLYSHLLPLSTPEGIHADYFTFLTFNQLFFFRPGPAERIKGLWGKGITCRLCFQGTLYFQLDDNSLTLQFLPEVNRILTLLELNETLKSLSIQCCLFKLPQESLPSSITKLTLRYVQATFRLVCEITTNLKLLETLIFEGTGDYVDLECIQTIPSLKHLTLCNVTVCELLNKVNPLESCTLSRVKLQSDSESSFNETFPGVLTTQSLVLADDGINRSFNYKTLHSILMTQFVCIKTVTFLKYDKSIALEAPEDDLSQHALCESFLSTLRIQGNNFRVHLEGTDPWEWTGEDISPGGSDVDESLEGYLDTLPYFLENDKQRRTNNLKRLRDREFAQEGYFVAK